MPKWLHDKLSRSGRKRGLTGGRLKAYIYSTLKEHKVKKKKRRKGSQVAKP